MKIQVWKRSVCVVCVVLLLTASTAAVAPLEGFAMGDTAPGSAQRVPWGGGVDFQNDLGWAQFAVGPVANGERFEVELTISNTNPSDFYAGVLRLADTDFAPLQGVIVQNVDPLTNQVTGIQPQFTEIPFSIAALGTVKWRFLADSGISNVLIGFLLLHALSGSNVDLVTTFTYLLLGASGLVIDRIPVLPLLAASLFQFTYCRLRGLTTGIAIVALASVLIRLSVYDPRDSFSPQGRSQFALIEMSPGQRTFFPEQFIPGLNETIPGALVTVEFLSGGVVGAGGGAPSPVGWVAALDVTTPPRSETIQIAGKEVRSGASQVLFSVGDGAPPENRR